MARLIYHRPVIARLKSLLGYIISIPFYLLSFLVPRDRNIWVFGAWFGYRYADNSRHVFEYVCKNEPSIRAIWLSRDATIVKSVRRSGYESHLVNSWRGYWLSCRAGIVFSSNGKMDLNRPAISRAKKIQLWHGIPLKKIGLDYKVPGSFSEQRFGTIKSLFNKIVSLIKHILFPFTEEKWDIITSTSPIISERMAIAYGVHISKVKITGYPRNDALLEPNSRPFEILNKFKRNLGVQKFILYAPTFRSRHEDIVSLFSGLNIDEFEACLLQNNAAFLIKMHPIYINAFPMVSTSHGLSRVYWLNEEDVPELNNLLPHIDILITDYSGAYIDYLLLNRPIIFTPFDLDQYLTTDFELFEDYEQATPGVKCANWGEVIQNIDSIFSGFDPYEPERLNALKKYHTYTDANSSMRVLQLARKLVK
jgi:CDP-glycerol glycerophosphotransferase (TagB/SpsB family)